MALAEGCLFSPGGHGAQVTPLAEFLAPEFLFGEPGASVLLTVEEQQIEEVHELLDEFDDLDFAEIGEVTAEGDLEIGYTLLERAALETARGETPYGA